MFSKTNTPRTPAEAPKRPQQRQVASVPSILGRDILIKGDIKSEGDIQIDGRHEGNIEAATLTIGEQGAINGAVKAKAVYIRGKVTGKISANLVELAETANVQADIVQDKLTIANGAFFDGKCSRLTKMAQPARPTAVAAAKPTPIDTKAKKTA